MKKYGNPMDQLYMWLREHVTEEVIIEGQTFGVVMDGHVIGLAQLGEVINRSGKVAGQCVKKLEQSGMLIKTRIFQGQSFLVNMIHISGYLQCSIKTQYEGKIKGSKVEDKEKIKGSKVEDKEKIKGSKVEEKEKVKGSKVEEKEKVKGSKVEEKEKVKGSKVEEKEKVNGNKPEQKDLYVVKNKELKESIKNIYFSFSSLTSVKGKIDKKDEACIKGLLEEGLTEQQMIAWVKDEYARIQQKEWKNIVVFRYFESYLRQRYKRELVRLARLREEPEQVKIQRQWQAEAADRDFVRKLLQEVNEHVQRIR